MSLKNQIIVSGVINKLSDKETYNKKNYQENKSPNT